MDNLKSIKPEGKKCHYPNCTFTGPPCRMKKHILRHESQTLRPERTGLKYKKRDKVKA